MAASLAAVLAVHVALMGLVCATSAPVVVVKGAPRMEETCRTDLDVQEEEEEEEAGEGEEAEEQVSLLHVSTAAIKRQLGPVILRQKVQAAQEMMHTAPDQGCAEVLRMLNSHREIGMTGAWGMSLSRLDILRAGIGEAAAQGLLSSLAAEERRGSPTPAGSLCWAAITSMGVQYDPERSLALYESSPHLWDAIVAWNRRVMHDHELLRNAVVMFAGLYGVPPSEQASRDLDKAGAFDVIFDVLQYNFTDLVVAQAAWAGLSDNVENSRVGAQLAADHGGPGVGLKFLVHVMRHYHGEHAYQPSSRFGLRYESIHDVNGILMHDDLQRTWTHDAVAAGFLEEAVLAMREEPEDLLTAENGCEAISLTATGNTTHQALLRDLGAIELMVEAIERFADVRDGFFYHLHSCSSGLLPFARSSTEDQDAMLRLGLWEVLEISIPKWVDAPPRRDPWNTHFPWSKVQELQEVLQARRGL